VYEEADEAIAAAIADIEASRASEQQQQQQQDGQVNPVKQEVEKPQPQYAYNRFVSKELDANGKITKINIGYGVCVSVGRFNGIRSLHIRRYNKSEHTGLLYPTKFGVCFEDKGFAMFRESFGEIDALMSKLDKKENVQWKKHVGQNIYVAVNGEEGKLDIRKHFFPSDPDVSVDEPLPSTKGFSLSRYMWNDMKVAMLEIAQHYPDFANATPCYLDDSHNNQMFECTICRPGAYYMR